jgi:hypothetical protein
MSDTAKSSLLQRPAIVKKLAKNPPAWMCELRQQSLISLIRDSLAFKLPCFDDITSWPDGGTKQHDAIFYVPIGMPSEDVWLETVYRSEILCIHLKYVSPVTPADDMFGIIGEFFVVQDGCIKLDRHVFSHTGMRLGRQVDNVNERIWDSRAGELPSDKTMTRVREIADCAYFFLRLIGCANIVHVHNSQVPASEKQKSNERRKLFHHTTLELNSGPVTHIQNGYIRILADGAAVWASDTTAGDMRPTR